MFPEGNICCGFVLLIKLSNTSFHFFYKNDTIALFVGRGLASLLLLPQGVTESATAREFGDHSSYERNGLVHTTQAKNLAVFYFQ